MKKLALSLQFLSILLALQCNTYPMFYFNKLTSYANAFFSNKNKKDPSKDPSINTDGICWLSDDKLPSDVQNKIAQYLTFNDRETDTEFITRAKELLKNGGLKTQDEIYKKIHDHTIIYKRKGGDIELIANKETRDSSAPHTVLSVSTGLTVYSHKNKVLNKLYATHRCFPQYFSETFFEVAPDFSKAILVEDFESEIKVNAFDIVTKKNICKESLKKVSIGLRYPVAISSDGSTLAFVEDSQLKIKNILKDKNKEVLIPLHLVQRVDFNKQGTKIIVQGGNGKYIIHPLVSQEKHALKSKKTLPDYFNQKGIKRSPPKSINDFD